MVGSSQLCKLDDDSEGNLVPKDAERSGCVPTGTARVHVAMANIKITYKMKPRNSTLFKFCALTIFTVWAYLETRHCGWNCFDLIFIR